MPSDFKSANNCYYYTSVSTDGNMLIVLNENE